MSSGLAFFAQSLLDFGEVAYDLKQVVPRQHRQTTFNLALLAALARLLRSLHSPRMLHFFLLLYLERRRSANCSSLLHVGNHETALSVQPVVRVEKVLVERFQIARSLVLGGLALHWPARLPPPSAHTSRAAKLRT